MFMAHQRWQLAYWQLCSGCCFWGVLPLFKFTNVYVLCILLNCVGEAVVVSLDCGIVPGGGGAGVGWGLKRFGVDANDIDGSAAADLRQHGFIDSWHQN